MTRIVLASASPRRRELLNRYDIEPIVVKARIQEKIRQDEIPEQIAMALSYEKADQIAQQYTDDIVIGADTIVVCENRIIGKPKDEDECRDMLNFLSDKIHEVITGIAIINISKNIKIIDYERTIVKFRKLNNYKIENYIKTNEYIDKAGGYAIQGIGGILVEYIIGCYFNVIGLPIYKLDNLLEKFFKISLL